MIISGLMSIILTIWKYQNSHLSKILYLSIKVEIKPKY